MTADRVLDVNPVRIARLRDQLATAEAIVAELLVVLDSHVELCDITGVVEPEALVRSRSAVTAGREWLAR